MHDQIRLKYSEQKKIGIRKRLRNLSNRLINFRYLIEKRKNKQSICNILIIINAKQKYF